MKKIPRGPTRKQQEDEIIEALLQRATEGQVVHLTPKDLAMMRLICLLHIMDYDDIEHVHRVLLPKK